MSPTTIPLLLEQQATRWGDRTAIIGNDGTGVYQAISFVELLEYADQVASALAASIAPDRQSLNRHRVCWSYDNSNSLVALVLFHAILRMGGVNVPINPGASAGEMEQNVVSVDAAIAISPQAGLGATRSSTVSLDISRFDDLLEFASSASASEAWATQPDDPAVILFTSGTTGRSKGVVHSHSSAMASGRGWGDAFELTSQDVYQAMYPVYAGSGLHFSGLACLSAGSIYVIDESRPTRASLGRVAVYGTTVYAAVPSIYQYWVQEYRSEFNLGSLRLLNFGGAIMHRSAIEMLREFAPGVKLMQTYGLTEAGPGGLFLPPELLDYKLGAIGSKATRGLQFRLDTTVAKDSKEPGKVGELLFSGDSIMLGYFEDPLATESVLEGEWLRTGDLVRIDDDGCVYFLDRLKDLIVRGGFNISAIEVEETLLQFPGVREVAAFGVPHDSLGEVVAVAIVLDGPGDLDFRRLRQFAKEHLARVNIPEQVVVVDAMPLSAAGKVQKGILRAHPNLAPWEESKHR